MSSYQNVRLSATLKQKIIQLVLFWVAAKILEFKGRSSTGETSARL